MNLPQATRHADPITSHIAERETTTSGRRVSMMMQLVEQVRKRPGHTAGEYAGALAMARSEVSKRLADARALGLVENGLRRECFVKKSMMMTWYPKD